MGREILLTISVSGPSGERTELEAVVDTDFTGMLCLGAEEIETLGCPSWAGGTQCLRTGGRWRCATIAVVGSGMAGSGGVQVLATEGSPLVGMTLLRRSPLTVEVAPEGEALVEELS